MQNRRVRLDDRPTDRPDESMSHVGKTTTIFIKSDFATTEVVGKCHHTTTDI